jgi:C-terminal processing protease CtpA/Prc
MRRLHALLIAAGLLAAPTSAVAGPRDTKPDEDWSGETFEWSMATSRARLGVTVVGLTPELREHFGAARDRGVMVGRIEPKSAAAAAGLAVGDILTAVEGTTVDAAADVLSALAAGKKGDAVRLSVVRDRMPLTLTAKLLDDPGPAAMMLPRWPSWIEELFERRPAPGKRST